MIKFVHPSSILVTGPTGSGKTAFVIRLIKEELFTLPFDRSVWIYNEWQAQYDELKENSGIEFREDCDEAFYQSLTPFQTNLVVLDDQMNNMGNSKVLTRLFTEGSHHRNLSVIYIVQNLFDKGRSHRNVSLNSQYLILLKNPRETAQIECLSRQIYGKKNGKFLIDAFKDATSEPYGYLVVDLRPDTEEELRIRTKVFKGESCEVYRPSFQQ
jgi:adenylate kinase family enzyme